MILTIGVNALNMLFSVYFVEFAGMKSNGVAMGTVLAQWLGLALALGLFLGHYRGYWRLRAWAPTVSLRALKSFFSVNRDIFLRTVGLLSIFAFFTAKSAELGTTILAANLLLMQLKTFAAYGIDGFAFATESLVGRFTGARSPKRLWLSLRLGFLWGGGIGLGLALVYWLGDVYILRIFSDQQPIIDLAVQYLPWLLAYVAVAAVAFLWDGVFVGLTASGAMRNSMIWALGLGFLPAFYIAPVWLGNDGLWLAMLLSIVARGLSQTLMAPRLLPPRPNRTAVPPRKAAAAGE
jgi:MATE family multidrug resistance protein